MISDLAILQPAGQEVLPDAETLYCVPTFDFIFSLRTFFGFPSRSYSGITAVVEIWKKEFIPDDKKMSCYQQNPASLKRLLMLF